MPVQLPIAPNVPFQEFRTTLAGVEYLFVFSWNGRASAWHFDLYDSDGDPIRLGVRAVLGTMPGRRSADIRFPRGALIVTDTSQEQLDATLEDFGTRVLMHFYTPEELLV